MPNHAIALGVQQVRFTFQQEEAFAPGVVQSIFRVDVDHCAVGALWVSGVIHEIDTETLLRLLDGEREDDVLVMLRRIRRGVACVFGLSGKTVTCTVREGGQVQDGPPFALWRAQCDGVPLVELRGPGHLRAVSDLEDLQRDVAAAFDAQGADE